MAKTSFYETQRIFDSVYGGNLAELTAIPPDLRVLALESESLQWVAACGGHVNILQFMHDNGVDLMSGSANAMRGAARSNHPHVIDWLYENTPVSDKHQDAALMLAFEYGHLDAIKCLRRHGADLTPFQKILYRCPSAEVRTYFDDQKRNASATYVNQGCAQAVAESKNLSLTKRALRTLGL